MWRYIAVRVLQMVPVLVLASMAIWALIYMLPGDPALVILGTNATPAQLAALRQSLGLNQPLPVQYVDWIERAIRGNFGTSYTTGLPVAELIAPRAAASLQLGILSFIFSVIVGVPFGIFAAARPRSWVARIISAYNSMTLAVPSYLLGLLLILVFGVWLNVFPTRSQYIPIWEAPLAALQMSLLPLLTLGSYASGIIARFVRSAMIEVLTSDYIRTARAKGVRESVVIGVHALRNAILPTITIIGLQIGAFVGGAVVTEGVFNYPGMGSLVLSSVQQRDYPTVQAVILLIVVSFLVVNLLIDIVYAMVNPRLRHE